MRKIPTLFVRDFEHDNGRYVTPMPNTDPQMDGTATTTVYHLRYAPEVGDSGV